MYVYKGNYSTVQMVGTTQWELVPLSSHNVTGLTLYNEGGDTYLFIGDDPEITSAFKMPGGSTLTLRAQCGNVWLRTTDTSTVVYGIV